MTCPDCGSDDSTWLGTVEADLAMLEVEARIHHCNSCGHEWETPAP